MVAARRELVENPLDARKGIGRSNRITLGVVDSNNSGHGSIPRTVVLIISLASSVVEAGRGIACLVIHGRQPPYRSLCSRGIPVLLDRRRADFIERAGEPLFVISPTLSET